MILDRLSFAASLFWSLVPRRWWQRKDLIPGIFSGPNRSILCTFALQAGLCVGDAWRISLAIDRVVRWKNVHGLQAARTRSAPPSHEPMWFPFLHLTLEQLTNMKVHVRPHVCMTSGQVYITFMYAAAVILHITYLIIYCICYLYNYIILTYIIHHLFSRPNKNWEIALSTWMSFGFI